MSKYDTLVAEYRKLAKQADQRMVRLEKYAEQEHYKGVKKYAYARAVKEIESRAGGKEVKLPRWNTKPPANYKALESKIKAIKQFLDSPSSTKQGITNIYKKRANTVNERYGTNFKWQDLANYFESAAAEQNDAKYGSKTLMQAIGTINKKELKPEDIQAAIDKNMKIDDDLIVDEVIKQLHKSGQSFETLFDRKPKNKK